MLGEQWAVAAAPHRIMQATAALLLLQLQRTPPGCPDILSTSICMKVRSLLVKLTVAGRAWTCSISQGSIEAAERQPRQQQQQQQQVVVLVVMVLAQGWLVTICTAGAMISRLLLVLSRPRTGSVLLQELALAIT